jgi:hypothetical protein
MAVQAHRERGQRASGVGPAGVRGSIREVCLLGGVSGASGWALGQRVRWAGRLYLVAARDRRAGCVHLAAAARIAPSR